MAKKLTGLLLVVVIAFSVFGTTISAQAKGENYRYTRKRATRPKVYMGRNNVSYNRNMYYPYYYYFNRTQNPLRYYSNGGWDNNNRRYNQPSNQTDGPKCPNNNNDNGQPDNKPDNKPDNSGTPDNKPDNQPDNSSTPDNKPDNQPDNSGTPDGKPTTPSGPNTPNSNISSVEQQMINLINQARKDNGLPALQADNQLSKIARMKSKDMVDQNYFSHTSPTYGSPFDMLKNFGVSYTRAGENIAGNQTVERAHESLMNSSGHRANILSSEYTHIGIGIQKGGPYGSMYTQLFIRK